MKGVTNMVTTEQAILDIKYLLDKISLLGKEYNGEVERHKKQIEKLKYDYEINKKKENEKTNTTIKNYKSSLEKYEDNLKKQKDSIREVERKLEKRFPKVKFNPSDLTPEKFDEKEAKELLNMIAESGFWAWLKKFLMLGKYDSNSNMAKNLYMQIANAYLYLDKKLRDEQTRYGKLIQKENDALIKKIRVIENEYKNSVSIENTKTQSRLKSIEQIKFSIISDRKISDIEKYLNVVIPKLGIQDSGWINYKESKIMPVELLVGKIAVPSGITTPSLIQYECLKKIPTYNAKINSFVLPFTVSTGKPLLIYSETDGGNVNYQAQIFNSFVLRQLRFMPKNSIKISYIDPVNRGTVMGQLSHLYGDEACNICCPYLDNQDISKEIKNIKSHVDKVCSTLTKAGASTVYSYNASQKDDKIPFYTLVINDFPAGFDTQALSDLQVIIDKSSQCGISILISRKKCDKLENKALELIRNFEKRFIQHRQNQGKEDTITLNNVYAFKSFFNRIADKFFEDLNVCYNYVPPLENEFDKFFDINNLPTYRSAVKELNIPCGIDRKGNIVDFTLNYKTQPYAIVTGTVGSGKSTFLHALITSAALHYHPDELEMWLVDFKETEFAFYTHCCPHHLRYVVANESSEIAYSVIDEIFAEIRRRKDIFEANNVADFVQYREKIKNGKIKNGEKMPRLLVIVDEFHRMSNAVVERDGYKQHLTNLALEARSQGISLLFCDQDTTGLKGFEEKAKKRFTVRLTLRNEVGDIRETLNLSGINYDDKLNAKINELSSAVDGNFIYKKEMFDEGTKITGLNKTCFIDGRSLFISDSDIHTKFIQAANKRVGNYVRDKVFYVDAKPTHMKQEIISSFERKYPISISEGERYYIGSAIGLKSSFHLNLKPMEPNENILMVGSDDQKRLAMIKSMVNCALRNRREVVFLIHKNSMFYSKNKGFFKEGDGVVIYDTFPEICKFIGEYSNMIKALSQEEELRIHDESKFVIFIGLSELFDKMGNSRLTQEQAWKIADELPNNNDKKIVDKAVNPNFESVSEQRKKIAVTQSDKVESDAIGLQENKQNFFTNLLDIINKERAKTVGDEPACVTTETIDDTYSGTSSTISGYNATKDLISFFIDGWKINISSLVVLDKSSEYKKLKSQLYFSDIFNHRIALKMAVDAAGEFMPRTNVMKYLINKDDNDCAIYSFNGGDERLFKPYIL